MSRFLQSQPRRPRRSFFHAPSGLLCTLCCLSMASVVGCGEVSCPEGLSNLDGVCEKVEVDSTPDGGVEPKPVTELCDGIDNDGDDAVDEDWPALGETCGEGRGECVQGRYVCAENGRGVVCDGAIGPTDETCDGKDNDCDGIADNGPDETCDGADNDCDGLVDEGVWSVKQERFDDHATVASVDGGFVVTRVIGDQLRIETYDTDGTRTGHHDDVDNPSIETAFVESDSYGTRVLVGLGRHRFYVLEARVDSELVPIFVDAQQLHEGWDQGIDWGIYEPPYHPRVSAAPARFLGHRDVITFALSPFGHDDLQGLTAAPTPAAGLPYAAFFDAAGAFAVWEQADNVRAGWLLDDGALLLEIDIDRGNKPAIALGGDGPGVAYLQEGNLRLTELGGLTLQCIEGRFCNAAVDAAPIEEEPTMAMGLGFVEEADTWVIAAAGTMMLIGRREGTAVVKQTEESSLLDGHASRVDVVASGHTAAVVQAGEGGESLLTFMGCL